MKKETILNWWNESPIKQKLVALGIITLLSIGVLGAINEFSGNKDGGILSGIAESVGLKKKSSKTDNIYEPLTPPNGTLQLSKEYVYAGSRMLATEDYGIAPTNPTPTPPQGGGGAPTPTPTPPPNAPFTLTASPNSVTPGGTVTVSWTANTSRHTTDWIGIYQVGAPNTSFLGYQYIQGGTSGTRTFTMPTVPGNYEFRYFPENSYNLVATSNQVTVTP